MSPLRHALPPLPLVCRGQASSPCAAPDHVLLPVSPGSREVGHGPEQESCPWPCPTSRNPAEHAFSNYCYNGVWRGARITHGVTPAYGKCIIHIRRPDTFAERFGNNRSNAFQGKQCPTRGCKRVILDVPFPDCFLVFRTGFQNNGFVQVPNWLQCFGETPSVAPSLMNHFNTRMAGRESRACGSGQVLLVWLFGPCPTLPESRAWKVGHGK